MEHFIGQHSQGLASYALNTTLIREICKPSHRQRQPSVLQAALNLLNAFKK